MLRCWKPKRTSPKPQPSAAGTGNNECNSMNISHESPPPAPREKSRTTIENLRIKKTSSESSSAAGIRSGKERKQEDEVTNEESNSFEGKMRTMRKIIKKRKTSHKLKVGIFSRSAECEYEWLKTILNSQFFQNTVKSVQPCCITNNGDRQFAEAVSHCKFGILYHSQNRGRLNITNVTDSLYDKELQDLSTKLGKNSVIVVIDDLDDVSKEKKDAILEKQRSLKELAEEVFLFSRDEKKKLDQ